MICQIAPFTLLYRFNINRMLELQMDDDVLREREKGEEVREREEERKRERKEALDDSKAQRQRGGEHFNLNNDGAKLR